MKCPDTVQLLHLLDEQLPAEQLQQIEAHVEGCRPCQAALERLLLGREPERLPGAADRFRPLHLHA
jgi:hypothetical protein